MRPTLTLWLARLGIALAVTVGATGLAACGTDDDPSASGRLSVVVTTSILGDMVEEVLGDQAEVTVIMPRGADPHEFSPSARQAEAMVEADLLVVNGSGFEEGLEEAIERAADAGVTVFAFTDHVALLAGGDHDHGDSDDHSDKHNDKHDHDDKHDDDKHDDEHDDEHDDHGDGSDPHVWTDPQRMAKAIIALAAAATALPGIDATAVIARGDAYADELDRLDEEVDNLLAAVPAARRVLVTNHAVLGYFADRYDFEVVGTVIPSLTTGADVSAGQLDRLAKVVEDRDVPAIFADLSSSTRLAEALARSVGQKVEVVELHSESLGRPGSDADTYVGMMRTNARLIAEALR